MKEQLISFKTAKLAKEKGFEEFCAYYYNIKTKTLKIHMYDDNPNVISLQTSKNAALIISAPTQSLLQKWLRVKHNIHSDSFFNGNNFTYAINCHKDWKSGFKTYEQALGKGLQAALKLITN